MLSPDIVSTGRRALCASGLIIAVGGSGGRALLAQQEGCPDSAPWAAPMTLLTSGHESVMADQPIALSLDTSIAVLGGTAALMRSGALSRFVAGILVEPNGRLEVIPLPANASRLRDLNVLAIDHGLEALWVTPANPSRGVQPPDTIWSSRFNNGAWSPPARLGELQSALLSAAFTSFVAHDDRLDFLAPQPSGSLLHLRRSSLGWIGDTISLHSLSPTYVAAEWRADSARILIVATDRTHGTDVNNVYELIVSGNTVLRTRLLQASASAESHHPRLLSIGGETYGIWLTQRRTGLAADSAVIVRLSNQTTSPRISLPDRYAELAAKPVGTTSVLFAWRDSTYRARFGVFRDSVVIPIGTASDSLLFGPLLGVDRAGVPFWIGSRWPTTSKDPNGGLPFLTPPNLVLSRGCRDWWNAGRKRPG